MDPRAQLTRRGRRALDPREVERVQRRVARLEETLRAAAIDPRPADVDAVVDAARWARLEVDGALAFKGHVADLRDAEWSHAEFRDRATALETFARFLAVVSAPWDLVALRNLRARLDGLLAHARGLAAIDR